MLDEKKIQAWLDEVLKALMEAEYSGVHGEQNRQRFIGGREVIYSASTMLKTGQFDADPVPLKDIKVKTENIVRRKDSDTSWDAAIQQTSKKRHELYIRIMAGLHGMGRSTDEMLADYLKTAWPNYKFSPSGLRTRRSELVKAGWVKADGKKTIRNGNQATAWVTTN